MRKAAEYLRGEDAGELTVIFRKKYLFRYDDEYFADQDKPSISRGCQTIPEKTVKKEVEIFCATYEKAETLISNSFLSDELKNQYSLIYRTRRNSYLKG